jgi:hypothetical protein
VLKPRTTVLLSCLHIKLIHEFRNGCSGHGNSEGYADPARQPVREEKPRLKIAGAGAEQGICTSGLHRLCGVDYVSSEILSEQKRTPCFWCARRPTSPFSCRVLFPLAANCDEEKDAITRRVPALRASRRIVLREGKPSSRIRFGLRRDLRVTGHVP